MKCIDTHNFHSVTASPFRALGSDSIGRQLNCWNAAIILFHIHEVKGEWLKNSKMFCISDYIVDSIIAIIDRYRHSSQMFSIQSAPDRSQGMTITTDGKFAS